MKYKKSIGMFTFLTCLTFTSFNSFAAKYHDEINNFFTLFTQEKIDEAVTEIYKTNQYVSAIPDQIQNVKNQLKSLPTMLGSFHSIDKVDEYYYGKNLVHVTYLVIYDRQPLRFEFQFFKIKNGWRIFSFSFDDDLADEVKVMARKAAIEVGNYGEKQ